MLPTSRSAVEEGGLAPSPVRDDGRPEPALALLVALEQPAARVGVGVRAAAAVLEAAEQRRLRCRRANASGQRSAIAGRGGRDGLRGGGVGVKGAGDRGANGPRHRSAAPRSPRGAGRANPPPSPDGTRRAAGARQRRRAPPRAPADRPPRRRERPHPPPSPRTTHPLPAPRAASRRSLPSALPPSFPQRHARRVPPPPRRARAAPRLDPSVPRNAPSAPPPTFEVFHVGSIVFVRSHAAFAPPPFGAALPLGSHAFGLLRGRARTGTSGAHTVCVPSFTRCMHPRAIS